MHARSEKNDVVEKEEEFQTVKKIFLNK